MRQVVTSSYDQRIIFWDIVQAKAMFVINLQEQGQVSAHSLAYSSDFNVIFSAGYEKMV